MVAKQRFQVLFRRWLSTVMKMVGAILLFRGLCIGPAALSVCAHQHFGFADRHSVPPSCSRLCTMCWLLVGIRRVVMVQTAQVTRFLERATAMPPEGYWNPEAVRTDLKAAATTTRVGWRFAMPGRNPGSIFGKGGEETGTSRLLRLSLLDSLKEIRNAKCYELRRQPGVGART